MYLNDEEQFGDKWKIIQGKGERKNYDAYVIVQSINDKEIEQMRYRKSDMAIVHIGVLKTENITVKKLDECVQRNGGCYGNFKRRTRIFSGANRIINK